MSQVETSVKTRYGNDYKGQKSGKTKRKKRKAKSRTSPLLKIALWLVLVIVMSTAISAAAINYISTERAREEQELMMNVVEIDTIYPNIFVGSVDVSGLTVDQATTLLNQYYQKELNNRQLSFVRGNELYEYPFSSFEAKYDFKAAAMEAFQAGRSGEMRKRYEFIMSLKIKPLIINPTPQYSYSEALLMEQLLVLEQQFYVEPVNATIRRENGAFVTTEGKSGFKLNLEQAKLDANEVLKSQQSGQVRLYVENIQPKFMAADYEKSKSLIGSFTTTFQAGDNGRNTNITTAANKISNVVLEPGEVFSTNEKFGPSTYENGYRPAPVIVNGKLQDDFGGGICQVSSTLYNAVLFSELQVVERQNHSLKVSYTDYGFDATLAGDYIDFKFKNNTEYPVIVESILTSNSVKVNLYGHEIHPSNRKIEFKNELVEKVSPSGENVTEDKNLPQGTRKVVAAAKDGYRYKVYKIVYVDNKQVEKTLVNTSYYKPVKAEVVIGTGAAQPNQSTDPTPAPAVGKQNNTGGQPPDVVDTPPVMPDSA